jgi:hypothetical protein
MRLNDGDSVASLALVDKQLESDDEEETAEATLPTAVESA